MQHYFCSGLSLSTVNEFPSISYWNFAPTAASFCSTGAILVGSAIEFSASRSLDIMLEATAEYLPLLVAPAISMLAVCFSGLGPTSHTWIREIGSLAQLVRSAAEHDQGLTSIISAPSRAMGE